MEVNPMRRTYIVSVPLLLSIGLAGLAQANSPSQQAKRFGLTPSEVTMKKGEPVLLVLTSDDVSHGLRFRELNVNLKAPKGGSAEAQFTPKVTGDFVGHCSVFCGSGHGSMALTLHVV